MNTRFLYIVSLCIVLLFSNASYAATAKTITISGAVSDSVTHNPIQAAAITAYVSGTPYKALTDSSGNYSLDISFTRKPALIILIALKKNYLPSVRFLNNIDPEMTYTVNFALRDITLPSKPVVTDDGQYTNSINTLHAGWSSEDPESGIKEYRYSIGTSQGAADVVKWTSAGADTEITLTNLNLTHNSTYYFNVRAINGVNLPSSVGSSDGITINAHLPEITRVIPYSDSTLRAGDSVSIEAAAYDPDNDPIEYQFSIDNQLKQPWSSSNILNWTVEPASDNKHTITVEVRDDKNGLTSQEVTYNIQNIVLDTTPPTAPAITTNSNSSSLNSIEAQWSSEDPESGITEYQYAIGTSPGGTDVVYWTTYGSNTQAFLSGLNLTQGQPYYLSAIAKNGAGLKSPVSTSPAITANKEPYIKINYPSENAVITDRETKIKGTAEGVNQITINNKTIPVNPDGSFEGPTLIAPGYAKRQNITSSDPNYIIMNFPGETTITVSGSGTEDTVSFYYYQTFISSSVSWANYIDLYEAQTWNYDALADSPFPDWEDPTRNSRRRNKIAFSPSDTIAGVPWIYETKNYGYTYLSQDMFTRPGVCTSTIVIHTPPATAVPPKPLILLLGDCAFTDNPFGAYPPPTTDIGLYSVHAKPLKWLWGNWDTTSTYNPTYNSAYVQIDSYIPDSDMPFEVDMPVFQNQYGAFKNFSCSNIGLLTLDTVREVPYNSGNYLSVNTIPIFQPDSGKGRGPSTELVNMPFLKLKLNEAPSGSQINTLEAKLSIADETKTFNLTETAVDSGIFADASNSFSLSLRSNSFVIPANAGIQAFNPNSQDELTSSVTSTFGNLTNKLFNLKESASDSLFFNDIKTFVTLIFNSELLPYQQDSLTIQYENGMLASEEILTETSPDSLIFSNDDSSFTIKLNNYQGVLPDNLDITINNTDYLEISKAELILPKVNSNPHVYTNEPMDAGSDLPPNNPLDEGQGVFKVRVKGLPNNLPADIISSLPISISTDLGSKSLNLIQQPDGSCLTPPMVLLPPNDNTTYDGILSLNSSSGEGKVTTSVNDSSGGKAAENKDNAVKGAFVGTALSWEWLFGSERGDTTGNVVSILRKKLDYPVVSDGWLTKQDFLNALPKYSLWYSVSHGGAEDFIFKTVSVKKDWTAWRSKDYRLWNVYPEDVRDNIQGNSYDFVFLNCCLSADPASQANTQGFIDYFGAKTYLGWLIAVDPSSALHYGRKFFDESAKPNGQNKPRSVDDVWDQMRNEPQGTKTKYYGDGTFVIDLNNR